MNFYLNVIMGLASIVFFGTEGLWAKSGGEKNGRDRLVIMSYNVENLFDATHDEGKDDYAFLPKQKKKSLEHQEYCRALRKTKARKECELFDWSEDAVKEKLKRVAKVILGDKDGQGADLMVLQEVENKAILETLRKDYLQKGQYQPAILVEGTDPRGIDIGIITRLQVVQGPTLHAIPSKDRKKKTKDLRGILEVTVELPSKELLTVFGVHLPAPYNPRALRADVLDFLQEVANRVPKDRMVVVGGDFNTTKEEDERYEIFKNLNEKGWLVSHRIGCSNCIGTQYFRPRKSWSFLDIILLSSNLGEQGKSPWRVDHKSIRVIRDIDSQLDKDGYPIGFVAIGRPGVSDHLPIVVELQRR